MSEEEEIITEEVSPKEVDLNASREESVLTEELLNDTVNESSLFEKSTITTAHSQDFEKYELKKEGIFDLFAGMLPSTSVTLLGLLLVLLYIFFSDELNFLNPMKIFTKKSSF
jgi:hypothetical protein